MNSGVNLPLTAIDKQEVFIDIDLRPLCQLYTINDTDESSPTFGQRISPDPIRQDQGINLFLSKDPNSFVFGDDLRSFDQGGYRGFGLMPRLLANYVFTDDAKFFTRGNHEILIEEPVRLEFTSISNNHTLDLKLFGPLKAIFWMAKRNDFKKKNIFGNFTNWEDSSLNPGSLSWIRRAYKETQIRSQNGIPVIVDTSYEAYEKNLIAHKFNYQEFSRFPIKESVLLINGQPRFTTSDAFYFNYTQIYQHKLKNSIDGVYSYFFSLQPTKYQPTGFINCAVIPKIQLQIKMAPIPTEVYFDSIQNRYDYTIVVYGVSYNIFRTLGGYAGNMFT